MFKTTKAKLIFVAIFSLICITVTSILIIYHKIDIAQDEEQAIEETTDKDNTVKKVSGIDLNGKYNQNDLEFEEKAVSREKIEIRYLQIKGLKNKTIENKINKEIETLALNCYKEKVKSLDEVVNVQVSMIQMANFADTVSFEIDYYSKIDNDEDDFYQGIFGVNYDLNTGEKISIEQVFTDDAPIENILRKSAYYSLLGEHLEENLNGDLIVSNYGTIEDDIAELIYSYKKGKIDSFYYSPRQLYIIYDTNIISVDFQEYYKYITIYNKYLSNENLYENNNIGLKNLYTLSERYTDIFYYEKYENEKNYLIDISIDFQEDIATSFEKELVNNKIKEIEKEIQKVKETAQQESNEFYVLNYAISVYSSYIYNEDSIEQTPLIQYNETGNTYSMSVHDFEENVEPEVRKTNRLEVVDVVQYIYDFSELLKIEPQKIQEYYNPQTGEKVVI